MVRFLNSRLIIVTISLLFITWFLTRCIDSDKNSIVITDNKGELFAGSASCKSCHKGIYDSFVHTAHHLTSTSANKSSIKGSFEKGKNFFVFGNSIVVAENRNDSFYQVEYNRDVKNFETQYIEANNKRFDITIGSNTKGQSYLCWQGNSLFQLPLSYFTFTNSWCNSPGYPPYPDFSRNVGARCLECHSTYAKVTSLKGTEPEQFNNQQIMYGVECESCHGAAAKHVAYQTQHPNLKDGRFVINPAKLSRQQSLDMCSLCHSGNTLHEKSPPFSFRAGSRIEDNFTRDSTPTNIRDVDVHGNQYGLLTSSQCFKRSETMTCNTCHNTHNNERGNTTLFVQRCQSCHNTNEGVVCPLTSKLGVTNINKNCISCHMPLFASKNISVTLLGDTTTRSAYVRSHYIGIYPDETKKIMALIDKMKTANNN